MQTAYLFRWLSVTALWQRHCLGYQDFKPSFIFCPLKLCFCLRMSNWFCFELTEIHLTEHRSRLVFVVNAGADPKKFQRGGLRKNYRRRRLKPRSGVHEGGRGLYILVMVCDDESTCRLAGFFFDGRWIGVGRLETLSMVRRYRGRLPSVRLKFGTF